MRVFIDESGDLKHYDYTNPNYTRYFVLAGIMTDKPEKLAKIVKDNLIGMEELKFSNSFYDIKESVLNRIGKRDECIVRAIIVDKESVSNGMFKEDQSIFYNWLVKKLFELFSPHIKEDIIICVDKRFFREKRYAFNRSIINTLKKLSPKIKTVIVHEDSKKELCLSAIDMICGAIRHEYQNENDKYSKFVKDMNYDHRIYFKK